MSLKGKQYHAPRRRVTAGVRVREFRPSAKRGVDRHASLLPAPVASVPLLLLEQRLDAIRRRAEG